jgi:hypothetical protein
MKKTSKPDLAAQEVVVEYAAAYARNHGLTATFPRLVVGMMRELLG